METHGSAFPPLILDEWEASKITLHLYIQIVGKIRLKLMPKKNHWWHVTLFVSSRGLSTRTIPFGDMSFEIEFDLIAHQLHLRTSKGGHSVFKLYDGLSVAQFYENIFLALAEMNIGVKILAKPYDHPSKIPFAEDHTHKSYDRDHVNRFWKILSSVNGIFERFAGGFCGKSCPVHLYWHHMDLTLTRFSGRRGPSMDGASQVEQEAYSHEVISFGFWAGDENVRGPAFYSYTYPSPEGLASELLKPAVAAWQISNGSPMAMLMYEDLIKTDDPEKSLFEFLESAYKAGAKRAGWNEEDLRNPV